MVYHRTTYSTTGQTPLARWDAGWQNRQPNRPRLDLIAEAFRWSAHRKVTKTATVSLHSNTYQVDPLLAEYVNPNEDHHDGLSRAHQVHIQRASR